MVKTTLILKDEIYKKLVDESVGEYGSTKKLSYLVNSKLEKLFSADSSNESKGSTRKKNVAIAVALTDKIFNSRKKSNADTTYIIRKFRDAGYE